MFTQRLKTSDPMRSAWRWVALLVLLGSPLACDRTPTAPLTSGAQGSLLAITRVPAGFESSEYFPIDVQRAAQAQYGSSATAVAIVDHLYGWRAQVGGQLYSIDMARAVASQYGSGYVLGAVGVGSYDWRAVHWSALSDKVLPVMPIGSDYFWNVAAVRTGLANFKSVLITIDNWYFWRAGATFRVLQPLVVFLQSSRTGAQWNALADSSAIQAYRYSFLYAVIAEYKRAYPAPGGSLPVALVPFTGSSPDVWLGAADYTGYAVAPPRASSITCPASGTLDARCSDATYAIGHELGHAFGLSHSCDAYPSDPNCAQSIMQYGKPQSAILLSGEISTLRATPFFFSFF
jgi:hypothetical protein